MCALSSLIQLNCTIKGPTLWISCNVSNRPVKILQPATYKPGSLRGNVG